MMTLRKNFWFFTILATSILLKNLFIDQPFTGHFGSYQSIVGMIAFEFSENNFSNFLYPSSLLLKNGIPALEMVYYPVCALIAGFLWKILGGSLDYWGRFQAIFFSTVAIILTYFTARRMVSKKFALWAAFFFAFSPMELIYGRAFMNEAAALALLMLCFLLLQLWRESTHKNSLLVITGLLFSCVLILRLHFIVAFPALLTLICTEKRFSGLRSTAIFFFSSCTLAALWFCHTYQVALTHPNVHTSLFSQVESRGFLDPLLLTSKFWTMGPLKAFTIRLWGPVVFLLVIAGFGSRFVWRHYWIVVYFFATAALTVIIPSKFYDHPFYLIPLLFPGALIAANVATNFVKSDKPVLVFGFIALVAFSNILLFWKPAFSQAQDDAELFEAVHFIQANTGTEERIIAMHGTSLDFLYYLRRYGYSFRLAPDRVKLHPYFKSNRFKDLTEAGFSERNKAFMQSTTWFEYLRSNYEITYFAAVPKSSLDNEPTFRDYLKQHYRQVSPPKRNFILYHL